MTNRKIANTVILATTVISGLSLPIVKLAFEHITPINFLFLRYLVVALLFIFPALYLYVKYRPSRRTLLLIGVLEFLATPVAFTLLYLGLERSTALESSLISATMPLFVTLGGIYLLNEKEERREWAGLTLAIAGTLILVLEPLVGGKIYGDGISFTGNLLIIGYNICTAFYLLMAKSFYRNIPKMLPAVVNSFVALPFFFLVSFFGGNFVAMEVMTEPSVIGAVLYMAVLVSVIVAPLYLFGQNLIEASEACLFRYLTAVVAIPAAVFLLGETVTWPMLVAVIIIATGIFLGKYRSRRSLLEVQPIKSIWFLFRFRIRR